jgi:hypothetical protein
VTASYRDLPPGAPGDEVLRSAESLAQIGVQTLVISPFGGDPAGSLEATFGPVMEFPMHRHTRRKATAENRS